MTIEESYKKYFTDRAFERKDLLQKIVERYAVTAALYPGSYTHVTPSFYIPYVVYVDSDGTAKKIFKNMDAIRSFVEKRKNYSEDVQIDFFGQSYSSSIPVQQQFDFLFSQYAGPISQECKKYLKKGGILVANNSHADAGLAFLDPDYELIAVAINRGDKVSISEKNLGAYFIPKQKALSLEQLKKLGKGIGYTKTASNYIFQKVAD